MSFQGDIDFLSLGDVVQNLATNQKTGTLTIRKADAARHIHFQDGKITSYAEEGGIRILDWLAEKEIIPADQLSEVVRRASKAKRKTAGEVLADMGLLDLETYKTYLEDLVKETLYEVLSIGDGTFEFLGGDLDENLVDREVAALNLSLNAVSITMEAARRSDDWQHIRRHIPSEHEIYAPPRGELEHLLAETQDELTRMALTLLDGRRMLREVIAKLPCSRFEACRRVAALIAEKKIRPLGSDALLKETTEVTDLKQTIKCLKIILEREPNNREILERLAEFTEKEGRKEESATYRKLLAVSYLEEGDLPKAEQNLRSSLELSPKDVSTWSRLWETILREEDRDKICRFSQEFTEHFRSCGLVEIVRDHMIEMVRLFPDQPSYKVELADARFALGDPKGAVQSLFEVGNDLIRKNMLEAAEKVFARIVKYDKDNQKARSLYEKIRSGKLAKRREQRRRIIRTGIFCTLFLSLWAYLSFELYVRGELLYVTKTVYADGLLERQKFDEAIGRIQAFQDAYPISIASLYRAPELIDALRRRHEEVRSRAAQAQAPPTREARSQTAARQNAAQASNEPSAVPPSQSPKSPQTPQPPKSASQQAARK